MIVKEKKIDPFIEWLVWGSLEPKTDLELILLKGHLLLEKVIETVLNRYGIREIENYSFYKKIIELKKVVPHEIKNKDLIIESLIILNRLRNKLAHELDYEVENDDDFAEWFTNILASLKGRKWCKYTHRTKIVHSFSVLAINVLNM